MGEESQRITKKLRSKGIEAYSVDLKACSGGHPEWHYQMDWHDYLEEFPAEIHFAIIGHPVCKRMANSGVLRLYVGGKKENGIDPVKWQEMLQAAETFKFFLNLPCDKLGVENPVIHGHALKAIGGVRPTQSVQPYEYGHPESKRTCLWLKGFPKLKPTNVLPKPECGHWENQTPSGQNKLAPSKDDSRATERAKTYEGIAAAIADQWFLDYPFKTESDE